DVDFIVTQEPGGALPFALLAMRLIQPPRPGSGARGTAAVRGRVVDTDGRPLAHAQVFAFAAVSRDDSRTATTDENGQFELIELGKGSFKIGVSKGGYAQLESGRTVTPPLLGIGLVRAGTLANFSWGRTIELAAGERREHLDLTMARWGAVSGRVF